MDMQATGEPEAGMVHVLLEAPSPKDPGQNGCVTFCFCSICPEDL